MTRAALSDAPDLRRVVVLLAVVAGLACAEGAGTPDAGTPDDAGSTRDAGAAEEDAGAADAGEVATLESGSVRWDEPLTLCSVNGQAGTIATALRTKRRVTLPPRALPDLREETLRTPLVDVLVETGVLSGEQSIAASDTVTLDRTIEDGSLSADVRHDFGGLGSLVESYRVNRLSARIDPLANDGELTFLWRKDADVNVLVPCDGFESDDFVSSVLRLEGPDGAPTASVLTAYRRNPETQAEFRHVPLASALLLGGDAPEQVDALGWSANTYAALGTDVQEDTIVDFTRDLLQWRTFFAPDAPARTTPRPVTLTFSDVGKDSVGQAAGTVTVDTLGTDGNRTSTTYRAGAFRRIDKRFTANEFSFRCAAIDDVITFWVGAVGPPDRRLLLLACRKFGAPFQKKIVEVIPLHWRAEPSIVGAAFAESAADGFLSDDTGVSLTFAGEAVRIEPRDGDLYDVTMRDAGGRLVHEATETLETPLKPVRPKQVRRGHADGIAVRVELTEVGATQAGPLLAPEKFTVRSASGLDIVSDWSRLAFDGVPGVSAELVATTTDGRRLTWSETTTTATTTRTLRIDAPDGTPIVPTTTLTDDGTP